MKIAVWSAGALGCATGGRLARAHTNVTFDAATKSLPAPTQPACRV